MMIGFNFSKSVAYASTALLAISGHSLAYAQASGNTAAEQGDNAEATDIVVTGSRIARPELSSPTPINVMDAEEIARTGRTNVEEILNEIPALVGSQSDGNSPVNGAQVGVNFLNLRNLGTARTLTLVNGRRHVASDELGSASVDVSSIPVGLIERVDVTTGGASAIYGADGVSGVVNFVMKKDLDGVRLNAQGGISGHGDVENYFASAIAGKNFNDGRSNVTFAYEYNKRNGIRAADRDFTSNNIRIFMNNPEEVNAGRDLPGVPATILARDVRDVFVSADGIIDPNRIFSSTFKGGVPLVRGINTGSPNAGVGVPSATIGGNGTEMWRIIFWGLFPNTERHTANLMARHEFSPSARAFIEAKYSKTSANTVTQSTFQILNRAFADNPFLPAAVRTAAAAVNAGTPGGPPIQYNRFDIDTGGRRFERETDTMRVVAGLEGDITNDLSYSLSLNYGRSDVERTLTTRYDDRYFAALDVVTGPDGRPVCRSTINPAAFANTPIDVLTSFRPSGGARSFTPGAGSGCVPLNPFIDDPAANRAAYDWIQTDVVTTGRIEQRVLSAYLKGNSRLFGFELPGGPAEFVLGNEVREDKASVDFSADIESGPIFNFDRGSRDQKGKMAVWEYFAEISLPIVKDGGLFLHELSLDGAYRFSDYSTIGTTHTWSVRGLWAPVRDLKFRGTLSQAIRAPNLNELFAPAQPASFLPADPCSGPNLNRGSATRNANCTAALTALGLTPGISLPSTAVNFRGTQGGNPNLGEETAKTYTVGAIFQPSFIPGLTMTADYWRIKMSDGIILPSAQSIVDNCYDSPTLNNPFCPLLGRAANGDLNNLNVTRVNVAAFITSGIDFSANYRIDLGSAGRLSLNLAGSYLDRLDIQSTPNPVLDNERGETGTLLGFNAPKWTINTGFTWQLGAFSLNYGLNYHSSLLRVENATARPPAELQIPFRSSELWNHDARVSYDIDDRFQIYGGVRNIGDQKPDPNSVALPIDSVGRYFYAGATAKF